MPIFIFDCPRCFYSDNTDDLSIWTHGAPIHYILRGGFHRDLPLLQNAGRASDATADRRAALRGSGWRDELDRGNRETYVGQHALALDRFSYQRWREAGPRS